MRDAFVSHKRFCGCREALSIDAVDNMCADVVEEIV
jgi:hypothetical protein